MKKVLGFLLVLLLAVAGFAYRYEQAEAPGATDARMPGVEEYVRQNIAQLSPEPAVLGGTFYVTDIAAADGRGTVSYEDGHVVYTADFEYAADKYGVTITSFEVRK